jgi:hypothetical protein
MSKYRTYSHRQKSAWDMDEDEEQVSRREYKEQEIKRKEKRIKNALKSKNIDALLEDEDDDEYDI